MTKTKEPSKAEKQAEVMRMYQIADEIDGVMQAIEDAGGEVTPEIQARWDEWEETFDVKVERCVHYLLNHKITAAAAKGEKDRFRGIEKASDNKVERLREYMLRIFQHLKKESVRTPTGLQVLRVKATRPVIRWVGAGPIPPAYQKPPPPKPEPMLDLDGALEAYNAGVIKTDDPNWSITTSENIQIR